MAGPVKIRLDAREVPQGPRSHEPNGLPAGMQVRGVSRSGSFGVGWVPPSTFVLYTQKCKQPCWNSQLSG
jgi:hypothetical protein